MWRKKNHDHISGFHKIWNGQEFWRILTLTHILEDYSSYFSSKTNVVGTQKNRLNNIKLLLFLKDLFVDFDKQIISILQKKLKNYLIYLWTQFEPKPGSKLFVTGPTKIIWIQNVCHTCVISEKIFFVLDSAIVIIYKLFRSLLILIKTVF